MLELIDDLDNSGREERTEGQGERRHHRVSKRSHAEPCCSSCFEEDLREYRRLRYSVRKTPTMMPPRAPKACQKITTISHSR